MELNPPDLSPYERIILRSSDSKELFVEKFEVASGTGAPGTGAGGTEDAPAKVDGLGIVVGQTPLKGKDGAAATGAGALPATAPSSSTATTITAMTKNRDCQFYETKVMYDGIKIPIRVPLSINPEEVGEVTISRIINIATMRPKRPMDIG